MTAQYTERVLPNNDIETDAEGNTVYDTVPEDETPRWRIVLTTVGGTTREIAAYRLDAFSDALAVDGVAIHYVHEEVIDLILADLLD